MVYAAAMSPQYLQPENKSPSIIVSASRAAIWPKSRSSLKPLSTSHTPKPKKSTKHRGKKDEKRHHSKEKDIPSESQAVTNAASNQAEFLLHIGSQFQDVPDGMIAAEDDGWVGYESTYTGSWEGYTLQSTQEGSLNDVDSTTAATFQQGAASTQYGYAGHYIQQ